MLAGPSPAQDPAPARASKRRLSDAACLAEYDYDDHDLDDDHDHDPDDAAPTRSKRTRPHNAPGAAIGSPDRKGPAGSSAPPRALSDKEKEQRRVARMIRNRNAAQASRDRKKEHTAFLERKVYELEQQLRQAGLKVVPTLASAPIAAVASSSLHRAPPPRSQRALSVLSDDAQGRIADLEDENDNLRSQLHLEQSEAAELRERLEDAEQQLARLAHLQALAPDAPFSPFSGTTTPLPAGYEPTFAFNTPNLSPLPQPEEPEAVSEPVSGTSSPAASYAASASSSSSFVDIASTPPATESYLELDDVTVSPVWSDWAKGAPLPPLAAGEEDAVMKPHREGADESALAFLDLSFLQDGPVTTSC
ncbi:hypothetical protein JCM3770_005380 [Rhodotorula araucariae]